MKGVLAQSVRVEPKLRQCAPANVINWPKEQGAEPLVGPAMPDASDCEMRNAYSAWALIMGRTCRFDDLDIIEQEAWRNAAIALVDAEIHSANAVATWLADAGVSIKPKVESDNRIIEIAPRRYALSDLTFWADDAQVAHVDLSDIEVEVPALLFGLSDDAEVIIRRKRKKHSNKGRIIDGTDSGLAWEFVDIDGAKLVLKEIDGEAMAIAVRTA